MQLDVLAGNASSFSGSKSGGEVRINGKLRSSASFARMSCYVQQKDVLMASATVRAVHMHARGTAAHTP